MRSWISRVLRKCGYISIEEHSAKINAVKALMLTAETSLDFKRACIAEAIEKELNDV